MKPPSTVILVLAAFLWVEDLHASGPVIPEEGVVYLEAVGAKPMKIRVTKTAPIYYQSDLQRYLGTLKKGQLVELQAVGNGAYRVRGLAQQGQVVGWVPAGYMQEVDPKFLEALRQNAERLRAVRVLIERKEVAINMLPAEVLESLGKPQKKSSRMNAEGLEEVWQYVLYARVPKQITGYDEFGRLVASTIYVKDPVGTLAIHFRDGLVAEIEQSEGTLATARAKIVNEPILAY